MNPAGTIGFTAVGTQVGPVVQYFAQIAHMPTMSDAVAGLIGAGILGGAHALWVFINARFPAVVTAPTAAAPPTDAPLAHPAPVATP